MKKSPPRFLSKILSVMLLIVLISGVPGFGVRTALAQTDIFDDGPVLINIPDVAGNASCGTTITRTLAVGSLIVADVNVGLNISHNRRSDVRVTLTSPSGTTVALISGGGLGSPVLASPDDYNSYDVLLDDSSINSLYDNDNDDVGGTLYDRSAKPSEPLTAFIGTEPAGNWTLTICDRRQGEVGAYNQSRLIITSADPNTVSGVVFTDYNDNGFRDQGDVGVPGVTVTAYNAAGVAIGTTTTDANGNYAFSGPDFVDGTPLRIEFTDIPSDLRPGAFGEHSGTTVQFVTSPAVGADLGLVKPDEYCQANPFIVSPCYKNGDPSAPDLANETVLLSVPYDAYGRQDDNIENPLATASEIGATWGLGFQRSTGMLFAGALAKRHVGLGPDGPGAIYSLVLDPITGNGTTPSLFLDLADFGIPTDLNVPPLGSNASRNLSLLSNLPNTDPTAWDAVGKVAIGDIDMGSDDTQLWVMNLANQTLYRIDVGNPATPPPDISYFGAFPVTLPGNATGCAASDVRPWAVEINQGFVYVGVVCSAESTQNVNDLRAYILRIPEGAAAGTGFTLVTEFALNYNRGFVTNPGVYAGNTQPGVPAEWRPWSSTMRALCDNPCTSVSDLAFGKQLIYPQPILSDIEFDTNGDLILGFMDRNGHQTGNANYGTSNPLTATLFNFETNTTSTVTFPAGQVFEGVSAGDTIRMCSNGLEFNASCGGITTGGAGNGQGPNGGEYYWQDMFVDPTSLGATGLGATTDPNAGTHHEITLGGLLLIPGTNEIAVSIFDPFDIRAGGIAWFNNQTGTRSRAYEVFNRDAGGGATTFGKAAGLGDIEGFCFNAPIEIGNRVWFDTDNDGVQDADEAPIEGVIVQLFDQNGNQVATTTTDVNGNYFFSSLTSGLLPNTDDYQIRIDTTQAVLAGLTLTGNDTDLDLRDSDGILIGTDAVITLSTGNPGDNNHTYDFGFNATYSLGNRVWLDDGTGGGGADNGIQDGTEVGIANVVVNLYRDTDNDGVPDGGVIATVTTDANGYYRFDNLTAGGYVVEIPASNFNAGNPLFSLGSSTPDETNPNSDVDVNDNGLGVVPDAINGIRSGSVTLGPGTTEPVTEPDVPTTGPFAGQGAPDDRANMTVDFGFVPSYSIGNRVWFDTDNDSTRDAGTEVGVDGVEVELYSVDAQGNFTLVATTTTANGGYYRFDGLPAGNYVVVITEDNFIDDGTNDELVGYWSSATTINNSGVTGETAAPDADNDLDDDDNGTLQNAGTFNGAVISSVVTLGPGTVEPLNEADLSPTGQGAIDSRANMTIDFGFYRLELGDLVFEDVNNNGTFDAGDIRLDQVLVQLFAADGATEIITGADGIPGTADDNFGPDGIPGNGDDGQGGILTDSNGNYLFSGLPQGSYVVKVTGPVGYTSTIDTFDSADTANPDTNTNNNDNGIGTGAGIVSSAVVTLTPGSTGAANNNTVNQNTGTTRNPTVDFGFVQANAVILKTVTPSIATIGQIVTYTVQIQVPPGQFANAQVVDTMQTGLALSACQSITGVGVTTSLPGGFDCAGNVSTAPGTGADIDRIVTFNLGTLDNQGQTNGTITIVYDAIVLDIDSNRGAATQTTLDNSALLTWNNTPFPPVSTTITLIEPDLQIVKISNTNFVAVGTEVEFTLTVTHTANSRADAFDVLITDALPAELDYVANSIDCDDGDQDAALVTCTYDAGTRTIIAEWSAFTRLPAGDELIIRFRVTGNALLGPGQTITNVGNVEWTSEPGDQTTPDSFSQTPNPFATERYYDPLSPNPINTIYGDNDALVLNPVGGGGGGGGGTTRTTFSGGFLIALTGFKAGEVTPLDAATRPEYSTTGLTLAIPGIKVESSIAGVQLKDGSWDVSWLANQAGWLEGTAYPTWSGNSVVTAHVVNADGKPGLFSRLKYVKVGDYVFVNNGGFRYTYQVVSNQYVQPDDIRVLQHEEKPHLTLITCDRFDFETKTYLRRVVVRAVLVDVSALK